MVLRFVFSFLYKNIGIIYMKKCLESYSGLMNSDKNSFFKNPFLNIYSVESIVFPSSLYKFLRQV